MEEFDTSVISRVRGLFVNDEEGRGQDTGPEQTLVIAMITGVEHEQGETGLREEHKWGG